MSAVHEASRHVSDGYYERVGDPLVETSLSTAASAAHTVTFSASICSFAWTTPFVDSFLRLRLREQELRLEKITRDQNSNVNSLVALVKENRTIIDEMQVGASR